MKRTLALALVIAACSGKTLSDSSDGGSSTGATGGFVSGGSGGAPFGGGGSGAVLGGSGGVFGGSGGVVGGSGGVGGTIFRTGRACATDAECGDNLFCTKADDGKFNDEGPAKGYCTAECSKDPTLCKAIDPDSVCIPFMNASYCMESCKPGPDGLSQFDPDKCHGRQEVACTPVDNGANTVCLPQCNSDSDCGGGLDCNPKTGLCTSVVSSGLPIGTACGVQVEGGTCEGLCLALEKTLPGAEVLACTQGCTLGAFPSCGWSGPGTGPAPAACLYAAPGLDDLGGSAVGDLGYCGKLCDCDDDCLAEYECLPWSGPDAQALKDFFQRTGYCGVNQVGGDAAVTPCGN